MMPRLILLFLVGTAAMAAEEPPLEHFARGYRLETDGEAAIYRLPLPTPVYRTMVRSDFGDIRVFNGAGERVPHAVRRPETERVEETVAVELPVFPIAGEVMNLGNRDDVDILIAEDGSIVRIRSRRGAMVAENAAIRDYVIDLSGLDHGVDELEFELAGVKGGYIKTVAVYASNDLNTWRRLIDKATLAQLDYGSHSLNKNTIKLPNRRLDYLRFHWREDPNGLQIRRVRASLNTVHSKLQRRWSEVEGRPSEEDERTFLFDTRGLFPIDRVNIVLPDDNTLIEAVLRSRHAEQDSWRVRHNGLFYNLQVNGNTLQGGPIGVRRAAHRYWQLEVKTNGGLGARTPKLQFAWIPNDLYFLARGPGPFNLAYGNGQVGAPGRPIQALMRVLSEDQADILTGEARPGEPLTLMGQRALAKELAIPWQRILLWGILVVGVIVIGVMALRLMHQINRRG